MNTHPIADADLDLYAFGALDEAEEAALEAHLAVCEECRGKVAAADARAALLGTVLPQQNPPAGAKERLMARIRQDVPGSAGAARRARRSETKFGRPARKGWLLRPRWSLLWAPAALGLAILAIGLWFANLRLAQEVRNLRAGLNQLSAEANQNRALVELLSSPDTLQVKLVASGASAAAEGRVYYHQGRGLLFYTGNLPSLPSTQSYQLWVVPSAGNPISAGVFLPDVQGNTIVVLPPLPAGVPAKAFAVTIEPAGGKPQPTGPKVLLGATS